MAVGPFRVVILSAKPPSDVGRIVSRIRREVPEAKVCGVLYERSTGKSLSQRFALWIASLRDPSYLVYVAARVRRSLIQALARVGVALLRFLLACPGSPNGQTKFELDDLAILLEKDGGLLFVTADIHSRDALQFVRGLDADLGVVYGTRILKPELFNIPQQGSINIHKRKVPDYRGGGPVGLWEFLNGESEIGVTVHRVEVKLDAGAVIHSATIPIDPYDSLNSLALKADVVGNDLIVRSVSDFARGTVQERPQGSGGRMFRSPKPQQLRAYEKQIAARQQIYGPDRDRPLWKLLTRAIFFAPWVIVRNWSRRLRGRFPVVILYHHLVSDRPHRLGISTDAFEKQVELLKKHYRIATLREAIEMLETGTVSVPTVVMTFDDGYQDNLVNLRAVTEKTGIPVTMFVCTGHIATGEEFQHDVKRDIRGFLPLSWEQITCLAESGFEFGTHTRSHFDCGSREPNILRTEIVGAKADLEHHLARAVDFFSFPWGLPKNMSRQALELAQATYRCVFSACGGVNFPISRHFWHLKRCNHCNDLFELELQIQSILDPESPLAVALAQDA